jgi:HEAT repeat protein
MQDAKEQVKERLRRKEYPAILADCGENRKTVRLLRSLLYDSEVLLQWRTVTMFGWLAAQRPKLIEKDVQRLIWSLNDEAGSIGRAAPETIGEIARNNIDLAKDGVHIVTHYLEDPETCHPPKRNVEILVGVLWAIGRVGGRYPSTVEKVLQTVQSFMGDPDPGVRGHALWAIGQTGLETATPNIETMKADRAVTRLYENEELTETSVGQIAAAILARDDNG